MVNLKEVCEKRVGAIYDDIKAFGVHKWIEPDIVLARQLIDVLRNMDAMEGFGITLYSGFIWIAPNKKKDR